MVAWCTYTTRVPERATPTRVPERATPTRVPEREGHSAHRPPWFFGRNEGHSAHSPPWFFEEKEDNSAQSPLPPWGPYPGPCSWLKVLKDWFMLIPVFPRVIPVSASLCWFRRPWPGCGRPVSLLDTPQYLRLMSQNCQKPR